MNSLNQTSCELYCVIVNNGLGSKAIRIAKEMGIPGATVLIGRGTASSSVLHFLGLEDSRKEIIIMAASKDVGDIAIKEIYEKMNLNKPHRGIGFTLSLSQIFGSKLSPIKSKEDNNIKEDNNMKYNLIITIVDRGSAEHVIDAATEAGSRGGTILNARGSGIHETQKIFNIEIEPEKEVIMILAEDDVTENITSSIRKKLNIDAPGKGIVFVLDVNQTYGLYKGEK
jgi:nitrogen regulatory protein PII